MAKDLSTLRDEAAAAVERGKLPRAIELYEQLEQAEPANPAWPKRIAETHRRNGNNPAAVAAFERAADKYTRTGFLVQAIAVCKLILQIDPTHSAAISRLSELVTPATKTVTVDEPPPGPSITLRAPSESGVADRAGFPDETPPSPPRVPPTRRTPVTIPPGVGLDALDLASVVPGSRTLTKKDGSSSGLSLLPIDEPELELLELEPAKPQLDATARLALLNTPLFAGLPRAVLEQLITRMGLVELAPHEVLFHEGDPGACLYVISEGAVSVESAGSELAELGPSSFFGEIALVTDLPRSATIRAIGHVELLSIDRDVVRDAAAQQPEVISVLLRFVRDRLVDRMTRTSPLFQPFVDAERQDLARRFELLEVVEGVSLIAQGERADGLYVLVAGRAEVWSNEEPAAFTALGTGDVFGEMSLLNGGPSIVNVRSATRVLALRMPVETFREVIMTHPQVLAYLAELADERSPRQDEDVELFDLHLDLL